LRRSAAFLYLKETRSSFEVKREKRGAHKAQRFADLLREAEADRPLSEGRFAELQQAVLDARFREFSYRTRQNWIGRDLGHREKIDFVPAHPEDVFDLMQGLVELSETFRAKPESIDPVVIAGRRREMGFGTCARHSPQAAGESLALARGLAAQARAMLASNPPLEP